MTMTTEDFLSVDEQAPPKVARDRWQRPLIHPVGGGDPKPYTRASTLGKALDDEAGLTLWRKRMVAIGIASTEHLRLSVLAHRGEPEVLNQLCEQADAAADAGAAATAGTAVHKIMDLVDEGEDPYVPADYVGDIAAYKTATRGLEMVRLETFVVDDELEVAGTYDRLWRLRYHVTTPDGEVLKPGTLCIGDLKTGKDIKYGHCSWGSQLSCYAHGLRYDPATNTRLEPEDINRDWGLIVHAPVKKASVKLYWIDLRRGRELAHLASTVRTARKTKTMQPCEIVPTWADQVAGAESREVLMAIWHAAVEAQEWTNELTELARVRIAELERAA